MLGVVIMANVGQEDHILLDHLGTEGNGPLRRASGSRRAERAEDPPFDLRPRIGQKYALKLFGAAVAAGEEFQTRNEEALAAWKTKGQEPTLGRDPVEPRHTLMDETIKSRRSVLMRPTSIGEVDRELLLGQDRVILRHQGREGGTETVLPEQSGRNGTADRRGNGGKRRPNSAKTRTHGQHDQRDSGRTEVRDNRTVPTHDVRGQKRSAQPNSANPGTERMRRGMKKGQEGHLNHAQDCYVYYDEYYRYRQK